MAVFDGKAYFTRNPPPPYVLDDFPDGERPQVPRFDWLIPVLSLLAVLGLAAICLITLKALYAGVLP